MMMKMKIRTKSSVNDEKTWDLAQEFEDLRDLIVFIHDWDESIAKLFLLDSL